MITTGQIRSGLTNVGSAVAGMLAAGTYMAQHKVDLYALWDQLNAVIAAITQIVATAGAFATTVYGIYNASTKRKIEDVVADPEAPKIASQMLVTPQTVAVANAMKDPP